TVKVEKGNVEHVELKAKHRYSVLLKKGTDKNEIKHKLVLNKELKAPIAIGEKVGKLAVYQGDNQIAEFPVESPIAIEEASWWTLVKRTTSKLFFLGDKDQKQEYKDKKKEKRDKGRKEEQKQQQRQQQKQQDNPAN